MGSWQLEVFKMFIYVTFPVAAFHMFNQPEIFNEWVIKDRDKFKSLIPREYLEQLKNQGREDVEELQ